jgi:HEAT repeat protein
MRGGLLAVLACLCAISVSAAQDEHVLIRMLHEGQTFKVRARAAMALANADVELARPALEQALRDPHSMVRVSAARALRELGDARALPALRAASNSNSPAVQQAARDAIAALNASQDAARAALEPMPAARAAPAPVAWNRVRYAVVLGEMRNQSRELDAALAPLLGERVADALSRVGKVAVLSTAQLTDSLAHELDRRNLRRFRVEGVLNDVRRGAAAGQLSVRCEISLLLLDEPARNLRSVLKGAATGVEPPLDASASAVAQERRLTRRALDGAVKSALADAWATLEGAAGRNRPASRSL